MFESCESNAVSAAILCLTACAFPFVYVMKKAGMMCGTSVNYFGIQPFSALHW